MSYVTLHLIEGFIRTDIHSIPTDNHLYLPLTSAHPKHNLKAIPYGIALKLPKNCLEQDFLVKRILEYDEYLIDQSHLRKLVTLFFLFYFY